MTDIHQLISTERVSLADTLDGFTEEQWNTPSLCAGWTVRNVAAHLAMPFEVSLPRLMIKMIGARGDFNQVANRVALEDPRPGPELSAVLRANARTQFKPPGFGFEAPLSDVVLHGQDICRPLGIVRPVPAEAAAIVAGLCVSPKAQRGFVKKGITEGLRFEASDVDWSHGDGALVRGPAVSIAMAITQRASGFDELDGDGVAVLRSRT